MKAGGYICRYETLAGTGRFLGRNILRDGTLNRISPCMYISLICPIPFIWKERLPRSFSSVPAEAGQF